MSKDAPALQRHAGWIEQNAITEYFKDVNCLNTVISKYLNNIGIYCRQQHRNRGERLLPI